MIVIRIFPLLLPFAVQLGCRLGEGKVGNIKDKTDLVHESRLGQASLGKEQPASPVVFHRNPPNQYKVITRPGVGQTWRCEVEKGDSAAGSTEKSEAQDTNPLNVTTWKY